MQISGPSGVHGAQSISAPHHARQVNHQPAVASQSTTDEVSISESAQLIDQVHNLPDIRQDRVDAIRAQLAAGTYETDGKLNTAAERLLDEIG